MNPQAILEGMGWKQGEGLGRHKQGIASAIKPKTQLDRNGLGHNIANGLVEAWWAEVFNETAKNVYVQPSLEESTESVKRLAKIKKRNSRKDEERAQSLSEYQSYKHSKRHRSSSEKLQVKEIERNVPQKPTNFSSNSTLNKVKREMYKNFVKSEIVHEVDDEEMSSAKNIIESLKETEKEIIDKNPIDNKLWKLCGGRTAHKSARYDVLKGKMERISRQELEHLISNKTAK